MLWPQSLDACADSGMSCSSPWLWRYHHQEVYWGQASMVLPVLEEGGPAGCHQPGWGWSWQFCPAFPCAPTAVLCSSSHLTPVPVSSDRVSTLCPAPCLGAAENSLPEEQDWASKRCSLHVSSKIRFLKPLCAGAAEGDAKAAVARHAPKSFLAVNAGNTMLLYAMSAASWASS